MPTYKYYLFKIKMFELIDLPHSSKIKMFLSIIKFHVEFNDNVKQIKTLKNIKRKLKQRQFTIKLKL